MLVVWLGRGNLTGVEAGPVVLQVVQVPEDTYKEPFNEYKCDMFSKTGSGQT